VSTTADSLPNDLESLRALAAQVIAERDAAIAERETAIKERDAERAEKTKLAAENELFAGHDDGAQNWAIVASLIESCKLGRIDPYSYLADVLFRLVNLWPNSRLDERLPWNWAAARDHLQRAA
jgi:hypothetical protein